MIWFKHMTIFKENVVRRLLLPLFQTIYNTSNYIIIEEATIL